MSKLNSAYFSESISDVHLTRSDSAISRSNRVNDLLVDCPDRVPLKEHLVLGGSLREHELLEGFGSHAPPTHTAEGWEARIVPTLRQSELQAIA